MYTLNLAIVLHSMCQPGLPAPHGLSQDGSPGFADFQRVKSVVDFFIECESIIGGFCNLPYLSYLDVSKYTEPEKLDLFAQLQYFKNLVIFMISDDFYYSNFLDLYYHALTS